MADLIKSRRRCSMSAVRGKQTHASRMVNVVRTSPCCQNNESAELLVVTSRVPSGSVLTATRVRLLWWMVDAGASIVAVLMGMKSQFFCSFQRDKTSHIFCRTLIRCNTN